MSILTEEMQANTYECQIVKLIDGDAIDLSINLGFDSFIIRRIRLIDIDAPEIHNTPATSEENKRGQVAFNWLKMFLAEGGPIYYLQAGHKGIYGRWLGQIWRGVGQESLNDFMIDKGYYNNGWSWSVQEQLIEEWYSSPEWVRSGKNTRLGMDSELKQGTL